MIPLPVIDLQKQVFKTIHPIDNLDNVSRKRGKQWKSCYQLISFTTPIPSTSTAIHKKYKIQFTYLDKSTGKHHTRVVYFGQDSDYVFTHDNKMRLKKLTNMKNLNNPFKSNYWSSWLMNKGQTIQQGFIQLQRHLLKQSSLKVVKTQSSPSQKLQLKKIQTQKKPKLDINKINVPIS